MDAFNGSVSEMIPPLPAIGGLRGQRSWTGEWVKVDRTTATRLNPSSDGFYYYVFGPWGYHNGEYSFSSASMSLGKRGEKDYIETMVLYRSKEPVFIFLTKVHDAEVWVASVGDMQYKNVQRKDKRKTDLSNYETPGKWRNTYASQMPIVKIVEGETAQIYQFLEGGVLDTKTILLNKVI